MKKLLTTLLVLALAGFVGFKAAVWWLVDRNVNQAQQTIADRGVIERGAIRSSLGGLVTLQQASYQDFRLTQPLQMGQLTFDAGSPLALLSFLADPSVLPGQWQLTATGLRLGLDANMFRSWVTAGGPEESALFAPACGPDSRQRLGSGDLVRVGITELRAEALLRQTADELYLELNSEGTGSLEIHWPGVRFRFDDADPLPGATAAALTVTVRDGGLMRRVSAYCARESGMAENDWSNQVLASFQRQLQQTGYQASDQLLALYRRWLVEGGELTVVLSPQSSTYGVPVRDDEATSTAELALSYNGAQVPGVYLTHYTPPPQSPPQASSELATPEDGGQRAAEGSWRTQPVAAASQWLGHRVRVGLSSGRTVEGRLVRADERQLEVARPVDGGEVAYPMATAAVTRFEIWRRGSGVESNEPGRRIR
ncbi:acetylornithine deacetylase [Marinobacter sp. SS21]|uniref:acetylornithine deacetylase n=1 Tax=Marinobacter sp. SS21 TaxID=2979460 RepID=UPI00232F729E|nr:acetylornithine deacetylase [Marinobacter sp. SS21]MDC0662268.1 acetylornithine deacetylase [Marinobacter sp. SS21]